MTTQDALEALRAAGVKNLKPYPHGDPKLDLWARAKLLSLRTPKDWRCALDTVEPYSLRCRAACVVFWDYSDSMESDMQSAIGDLVDASIVNPDEIDIHSDAEIVAALRSIGYDERAATRHFGGCKSRRPAPKKRTHAQRGH